MATILGRAPLEWVCRRLRHPADDADRLQCGACADEGVVPYNMCVLKDSRPRWRKGERDCFPFGIWFANANTLYVTDEGNGTNTFEREDTYTAAAGQTTAGLQKWLSTAAQGLEFGLCADSRDWSSAYPTPSMAIRRASTRRPDLPWSPATDGLRNSPGG